MIFLRFGKSGIVGGRSLQDQRTGKFKPGLGTVHKPYAGPTPEASSSTLQEML